MSMDQQDADRRYRYGSPYKLPKTRPVGADLRNQMEGRGRYTKPFDLQDQDRRYRYGAPSTLRTGAAATTPAYNYNAKQPGGVGGTTTTQTYGTEPFALSATELAQLDARSRALDEMFATAEANATADRGAAFSGTAAGLQQLTRRYNDEREEAMADLTARGLALSPAATGRVMDRMGDAQASENTAVYNTLGDALGRIARSRSQAQRQRQTGMADIAAMRATLRGDFRRAGL
jgi:hypothetical protein